MTDDNSLAVPPFCCSNGPVYYTHRASQWIDVWTEEKLVLRWINSLEVDLFVLLKTCTLNLMSLQVRILRRKGQFWESFTFYQLLFFSLRPEYSSGTFEVCHFNDRLLENYLSPPYHFFFWNIYLIVWTLLKGCLLFPTGRSQKWTHNH